MGRLFKALWLGVAVAALHGCVFSEVKQQQQNLAAFCRVSGTVTSEHATDKPLVVVLARKVDANPDINEKWHVFDHYVLEGSGRWAFSAKVGVYGLAAFEDTNSDLVYQRDEPFLGVASNDLVDCGPGSEIADIALTIPETGRLAGDGAIDIVELQSRTISDQMRTSIGLLTAVGDVTDLGDTRFSEENARKGLWRPFDFLFDAGPGIYLLEEYDPDKTPVLFVHGIMGTPRNFAYMIDRLDRDMFQPWVYYYPSGVRLSAVARHLNQTMMQLRRRLGFDEVLVVAHSAGGLVARSFVFQHRDSMGEDTIPVLATIATPWNGHAAAARGVERAPVVVHSWRDIAPESAFLTEMFYAYGEPGEALKQLPESVHHHLLFAFKRNRNSFGESDDRTVTVASQVRWEAQQDADRLYGFDETHIGVLQSEQVSILLNAILADGAN